MTSSSIPLVDLHRQHGPLKDELLEAISRVLAANSFILGEEVRRFEEEISAFLRVPHAIGVSSGTAALTIALRASGVAPGDEVITSAFSFFATAGAILEVGAVPVFADVESDGVNIAAASIECLISPKTRAVLPVHLYGIPADIHPIRQICSKHGLALIEDCAQALGGTLNGNYLGGLGDFGCFSFFPSKPLGGLGDGGMIVTPSARAADLCSRLRVHGARAPHEHELLGGNHRLDAIQAACLSVKLRHLERWNRNRAELVDYYAKAFAGVTAIQVLAAPTHSAPAYAHFTLRVLHGRQTRDALLSALRSTGIQAAAYYSKPIYAQPVPELQRVLRGDEHTRCKHTEARCGEVISLPLFPGLTESEQDRIVGVTRKALG